MNGSADPPETTETEALESLLRWYDAMGVDAAVDESPHDRFVGPPVRPAAPIVAARPSQPPAPSVERKRIDTTPASADTLLAQAKALAAGSNSLETLRANWEALPGCGLAVTASRMIFSGGNARTPLMLIGGAPSDDDERQGEIFAGETGILLDGMLQAIGLDRKSVYLANVIPWRPPGNRQPSPLELSLCLPFARRHIALAKPAILLCLGERAAQPLLGSSEPISRLRGRWLSHEGEETTTRTLVTYALDFLLKQPLHKRRAWADMQTLAAEMAPSTT